jgi:hypothetical protein
LRRTPEKRTKSADEYGRLQTYVRRILIRATDLSRHRWSPFREEADYRVALFAGFLFMVILSWFPPFGLIIAGFLIGILSAKPKEGALLGGVLAGVGALIQITFSERVVPLIGIIVSIPGLFNNAVLGFGGFLTAPGVEADMALFSVYCILGAIGGLIGGLFR